MFFYEIRFENESLDLVIDDDELKIGDDLYQLARFRIVIPAGLKIRPNTVAQIFGLADIDYFSGCVPMNINSGVGWQCFKLFGYGHNLYFSLKRRKFTTKSVALVNFLLCVIRGFA